MTLTINEAIEELEIAYAGLKHKRFFSNICISEKMNTDASTLAKKFNGTRAVTHWDRAQLAQHFELGEDGVSLFRLASRADFRDALKSKGIGVYSRDPVLTLCSALADTAFKNSSTLEFSDLRHSPRHRAGFERLSPADNTDLKYLSVGASTQFKFHGERNLDQYTYFMLLNCHLKSKTLSVICPISSLDTQTILHYPFRFPKTDSIRVYRASRSGFHRLFALGVNKVVIDRLLLELEENRRFFGTRDLDEEDENHGQLDLDSAAVKRLHQILARTTYDCAILDYEQI